MDRVTNPARQVRVRVVLLVLGLIVFSMVVFGALLGSASASTDRRELSDSMERTALAFRYAQARMFEQLTSQAELLAADTRLAQYLEALRLTADRREEHDAVQAALRSHLQAEFGTAGGDLLLLSGPEGRLEVLMRKRADPVPESSVEPSEATSGPERPETAPGEQLSPLQEGEALALPLLDAIYEDGIQRVGYLRPDPKGPLYAVSAIPLKRGERVDGVLVLANRVGETMLTEALQGLNQGLVAVVADGNILVAYDRRTSKRPSPVLLSSLEESIGRWNPPEEAATPEIAEIEVGGRPWLDLPIPLAGGRDQRPVAWALLLGDTSSLDEKVVREAWIVGQVGLFVAVMAVLLAWLFSGWVAAPVRPREP